MYFSVPCSIPRLASVVPAATRSRTLTSYLVGTNTVRYKEGQCLFLSENTMAVVVLGHRVNSVALRTSKKIHLESLVLHLCTKSYPNGNHLVYTYAL